MTAYIDTLSNGKRYMARATTAAGALIGQALDANEALARKRCIRQAYRWAEDRGFKITISHRKPAREVNL